MDVWYGLSGAGIGLVVGFVLWRPIVYRAIAAACARRGEPAPRHLPGWPSLGCLSAVLGAGANVVFATHLAAIPASLVAALILAVWHYAR